MSEYSDEPSFDLRDQIDTECDEIHSQSSSKGENKSGKKRKRFTNDEKYEVVKLYEDGAPKTELVERYGMSYSALNLWIRTKSQLFNDVEVNSRHNVKSRHRSPVWRVEQPLVQFFELNDKRKGADRLPLTGPTISEIAMRICDEILQKHEQQPFLGETELEELKKFSASESWARKFARTHGWKSFGNKDRQKVIPKRPVYEKPSSPDDDDTSQAPTDCTARASKPKKSVFPTEKPRLIYWGLSCHSDICRILLHAGSIAFDLVSEDGISCPSFQHETLFGQLPILMHGDLRLAQTGAINRYCARLGGLYPENPVEASKVDMIHDRCLEILSKLFLTKNAIDADRQNAVWMFIRDDFLPGEFRYLERLLESSDRRYFGDDAPNAADVVFYAVFTVYEDTGIGAAGILSNFPRLKGVIDAVRELGTVQNFTRGGNYFSYTPETSAPEAPKKKSLFNGY